jgi:CubicO group peptidase (beta-lactamase class C family)
MRRWLIFLVAALALSAPLAHAQDTESAKVDKVFAAWDRFDTPGMSVAVVRDGRIVYSRGYGMANLEYGVRNTPSTVFHVASLSKQFTAFAVHLLVQDGKLSLDDEVRKYVPELQVRGAITLRHLLHHTSGLRDQWNLLTLAGLRLDDVITDGDVLGVLFQQKQLNFAPGEEELYSNSGYTLLALVVQRVSGQSLAAFAQDRIFAPLGMKDTHFHESYGTLVKGRAASYQRLRDGTYSAMALSYSTVGPSSLFTTVEDLALWDRNFQDAKVGGAAVIAAMLTPGRLNNGRELTYASGLVHNLYRGLHAVGHSGSDAGYRSHILRLPEQRLSVLVLGNAAEVNAGALALRVADVYLTNVASEPVRAMPTEVEVQASDLGAYAGEFEMRPGFILSFTVEGNQLMVQATNQQKYPMFASAADSFFTKAFEASVVFAKPVGNAAVATATWRQNGRDLPLQRFVREAPGAQALQSCVGDYYSEELRTLYALSVQDRQLELRFPRGVRTLTPSRRDVFSGGFPIGVVTLKRNAAGACEGFTIDTGRVRDLQFTRVRIAPAP